MTEAPTTTTRTPVSTGSHPAVRGTRALPVAMILGSCLSLQFGAAFATRLFPVMGPAGVTAFRLGLAAVVLGLFVRPSVRAWNRGQWTAVVLFGLSLAAMNGSFYQAISRIPIGPAVAIEFLGPLVFSALGSRRLAELGCVAVALVGVSLFGIDDLRGAMHLDPTGVLFALVAGVFWAAYIVTSKRCGEAVEGHGGLVVAMAVGSLALMPIGFRGVLVGLGHPVWLLMALACALLASVIPYSLEMSALRRLPSNVFGVLLSLEPAVAAIAGFFLLGQSITLLGAVAIALVIAASAGSTLMPAAAPGGE